KQLKQLQDRNVIAIHTEDLLPKSRQLLLKNGFIMEVSKGWYIPTNPEAKPGETTSWYSSYWDFISRFLNHKYGENWCLSADQSLLMHAGNRTVPQELLLRSPYGNNKPTPLPHGTSLFNLKAELPHD